MEKSFFHGSTLMSTRNLVIWMPFGSVSKPYFCFLKVCLLFYALNRPITLATSSSIVKRPFVCPFYVFMTVEVAVDLSFITICSHD